MIESLRAAAQAVRDGYVTDDLSQVRVPATCARTRPRGCDQIEFVTAGGVPTPPIAFQNRPTFQQVVEVQGHRPR